MVSKNERNDIEKVKVATGRFKQHFGIIYKMNVQVATPIFGEVHKYMKGLILYSYNIEPKVMKEQNYVKQLCSR